MSSLESTRENSGYMRVDKKTYHPSGKKAIKATAIMSGTTEVVGLVRVLQQFDV